MVLTAVSKTATTTPEATSVRATRGTGSAGTAAGAMVSRRERASNKPAPWPWSTARHKGTPASNSAVLDFVSPLGLVTVKAVQLF